MAIFPTPDQVSTLKVLPDTIVSEIKKSLMKSEFDFFAPSDWWDYRREIVANAQASFWHCNMTHHSDRDGDCCRLQFSPVSRYINEK